MNKKKKNIKNIYVYCDTRVTRTYAVACCIKCVEINTW